MTQEGILLIDSITMTKLSTFLLLLFPIILQSQSTQPVANKDFFVGHPVYPIINSNATNTRTDINGDGIQDLLIVSKNV